MTTTLSDFLRLLAPPEGRGYRTLCAIDPMGAAPILAMSFNKGNVAQAEAFVAQHRAARNLYWTTNTVRAPLSKKPLKADMLAATFLHVDVDTRDPAALAALIALQPTILIDSGGGYQAFWALAEPVPLDPAAIADIEARNRAPIDLIPGADGAAWNIDRIMRLPFTTNFPTPSKLKKGRTGPLPASLVSLDGTRRYPLDRFAPASRKPPRQQEAAPDDGEPQPEAYADRSRHLLAWAGWALRRGIPERYVIELQREHPHAVDQADPVMAVQRCIDTVRANMPARDARAIELRTLSDIVKERRCVKWLLKDVIEANVLALLVGPRGSYKSFIALDWALQIAKAGQPVLILSGEGGGLDRRVDAWCRHNKVDVATLPVHALERPIDLSLREVLANLITAIEALDVIPALILIDTYSKFRGAVDEQDNSEVAAFLSQLSRELRHYFRSTILLVAHTGHSEQHRARGASTLSADTDAEYIVSVDDMRYVRVTRDRYKDTEGRPPLVYKPEVIDLGRVDDDLNPVTSVVMRDAVAPVMPKADGLGEQQKRLIEALASRPDSGPWTLTELRAFALDLGVQRRTAAEAIEALAHRRFLVSVGADSYQWFEAKAEQPENGGKTSVVPSGDVAEAEKAEKRRKNPVPPSGELGGGKGGTPLKGSPFSSDAHHDALWDEAHSPLAADVAADPLGELS